MGPTEGKVEAERSEAITGSRNLHPMCQDPQKSSQEGPSMWVISHSLAQVILPYMQHARLK